ncbi:MAG: alpha/beta hydrolase [Verrucomicrobia bacterium]|nr:alpha/beta hydrolase [Verrucomicrobiota bacterium]NBS04135.1 alpha/beta hydrolase [Verrucomicrobiota bacterium]NBY37214.1 alpha/beta hydrolase [Verrucomicrobiota bacterium]
MLTPMRFLTLLLLALATSAHAAETKMPLWPEGVPGKRVAPSKSTIDKIGPKGSIAGHETFINDPSITLYPTPNPNGAAVIVCPGGGYWFLSTNNEGTGVCEWLNSIGVTAILLRYRTPTSDEALPYDYPLQDLQRALGLVRTHAKEWEIDPKRVGVIGFSAGGNLVGHASWDRTPRTYEQKSGVDDPRGPAFTIFVYGGGFIDKEDATKFREGFSVPADAPPCFFVVAHNDRTNPIEAAKLYLEYKRQNIQAELHIYSKGGHGFGTRQTKMPVDGWTKSAGEWMAAEGFTKAAQ